jgi:hypothetical protein
LCFSYLNGRGGAESFDFGLGLGWGLDGAGGFFGGTALVHSGFSLPLKTSHVVDFALLPISCKFTQIKKQEEKKREKNKWIHVSVSQGSNMDVKERKLCDCLYLLVLI